MSKEQELIRRVEDALEQLRPYLAADQGDVSLVEVTEDGIARVKFLGACSSCSMSSMTLKAGIEQAILKAAPEVKKVEAVD
ncbi:MAG: NifU family protein [Bacteroidota bacterium]